MALADFQTLVDDLVRDRDQIISSTQRDVAIGAALAVYSATLPRTIVVDVVAPGGARIDLPAGFTDASQLVSIEYPIGEIPPRLRPLSEASLYTAPTVRQLDLPISVAAGESIRIGYTTDHQVDATTDTVPARHRQAVASLAASILCGQLASYYATEGDPTIAADTVDYKDKSQRFRLRARDLAAVFDAAVGSAPADRVKAASATVALERSNALGGRRLFHPARDWPR